MTRWQWKLLRTFNGAALRLFPTCDLQLALSTREGVTTRYLDPCERESFLVDGPAAVTINRD